jgi:AAA domain
MQQAQGRAEQIMSIQSAVAHTEKQQHLNAGQWSAAEEILTSRDVVQGLEGRAGVGKTTLLKSVREAAERRGYVVEGFAPTSRAANQLRDAGISADTLQGFLVRRSQPNPDRHLYMVDESSLASTKQVRDFLAKLESSDRVLLIGDTRQHQGVEAGKPFVRLARQRLAPSDQSGCAFQITGHWRSRRGESRDACLGPRPDMTGADRTWAARYAVDDVLHYPRGSQDIGIEKQSYTKIIATQPKDNLPTVQKEDGKTVTYKPARLYGVTAYRELERGFAVGDRLSFTAPFKELGVANATLA